MDSVRRYLCANSLFLLTLVASLAGHASLGWFGSSATEGPRLDQEESGRTSVAVQWIAQPPPVSVPDFEPIEPKPVEPYEAVATPDASPSQIELARNGQRDAVPFESSIEGVEPPPVVHPPQPQARAGTSEPVRACSAKSAERRTNGSARSREADCPAGGLHGRRSRNACLTGIVRRRGSARSLDATAARLSRRTLAAPNRRRGASAGDRPAGWASRIGQGIFDVGPCGDG
jgi:hypothetical protein